MNTFLKNRWVLLVFRILLGGIFLSASISKILDMSGFVGTVTGYDLIPLTLAEIYGWVLPWVELYLGCSLILGVFPRISAAISILVIFSFAIASGYALEKFPDSVCGCFGSFIVLSHPVSLTIDALMFLFALAILASKQTEFFSIGQWFNRINPSLYRTKKGSYYISLFGAAVLMAAVVTSISYGIELMTSRNDLNDLTEETVYIPEPLADILSMQLKSGKPVLIYVFAEGCSSCDNAEPVIEEVVDDFNEAIIYVKIDYYDDTSQVLGMGIEKTPTVWVLTEDNTGGMFTLIKRLDGLIEQQELKNVLDSAIQLLR